VKRHLGALAHVDGGADPIVIPQQTETPTSVIGYRVRCIEAACRNLGRMYNASLPAKLIRPFMLGPCSAYREPVSPGSKLRRASCTPGLLPA